MIHYKRPHMMTKAACEVVSPQAESSRPLAVNCPACKATAVFKATAAEDAAYVAVCGSLPAGKAPVHHA